MLLHNVDTNRSVNRFISSKCQIPFTKLNHNQDDSSRYIVWFLGQDKSRQLNLLRTIRIQPGNRATLNEVGCDGCTAGNAGIAIAVRLAWGYQGKAVGIALIGVRHVRRWILWVRLTVHEQHWNHRALYRAVERFRLEERLKQGLQVPLTLISAPPGFGKSSLVSQWIHNQAELKAGWLSLEPSDQDWGLFFRYLVASWQRVFPQVGER